jgi:molecular chaperone GrpE
MDKFKDKNSSQKEVAGVRPEDRGEPQATQPKEPATPAAASVASQDSGQLAVAYENLTQEKQELYDRLLRKQAEMDNFRKRVQREKEEFLEHATSDLVRTLLPVLDGFERALLHRNSGTADQFGAGVELIYRQLMETLNRAGVKAIETKGKIFDPHLHQAVEAVAAPGFRDQEIVEELQRGYKIKERLLRPAIVKVAVAGAKEKD